MHMLLLIIFTNNSPFYYEKFDRYIQQKKLDVHLKIINNNNVYDNLFYQEHLAFVYIHIKLQIYIY